MSTTVRYAWVLATALCGATAGLAWMGAAAVRYGYSTLYLLFADPSYARLTEAQIKAEATSIARVAVWFT